MRRLQKKIKKVVNDFFRFFINRKNRKRLVNRDVTLIASNCNGCLMLHDLGLRFNSPFVNMFIEAEDFFRIVSDLEGYLSKSLSFEQMDGVDYPVAVLGDARLHCVHYKSENEVVEKWNARLQRMDLSNCYIMFTDRDGCSYELLRKFDDLPFENKVVFTNKLYYDIESAFYVPGFEDADCVGSLYHYKSWNGRKYYDAFDYTAWFNEGNISFTEKIK